MKAEFYRFVPDGNNKRGGVLYAPESWPYPIATDGENVENWENLVVELRDGEYRPFQLCTGGANMVDEDLKNLLLSYMGESKKDVEFLPVLAKSKEYGDRQYYIMHFKKIFDVVDWEDCVYICGSLVKIRLDPNKVKDLSVFNSQPYINDIIVSDKVRRAIKKKHLDLGLIFMPIFFGEH